MTPRVPADWDTMLWGWAAEFGGWASRFRDSSEASGLGCEVLGLEAQPQIPEVGRQRPREPKHRIPRARFMKNRPGTRSGDINRTGLRPYMGVAPICAAIARCVAPSRRCLAAGPLDVANPPYAWPSAPFSDGRRPRQHAQIPHRKQHKFVFLGSCPFIDSFTIEIKLSLIIFEEFLGSKHCCAYFSR